MREVIPKLVWIGNGRDARDVAAVLACEIQAVVHLAVEESPTMFPRDIIYCRFPLLDGSGNPPAILRTAIQTVCMLIDENVPILVACSGGMSRSPAILAAAMARAKRESPEKWLTQIAAAGPHDVAPALWNEIRHCVERS